MVKCKHCQDDRACFAYIDRGTFEDVYYCPECDRKGALGDDFELEEEQTPTAFDVQVEADETGHCVAWNADKKLVVFDDRVVARSFYNRHPTWTVRWWVVLRRDQ